MYLHGCSVYRRFESFWLLILLDFYSLQFIVLLVSVAAGVNRYGHVCDNLNKDLVKELAHSKNHGQS